MSLAHVDILSVKTVINRLQMEFSFFLNPVNNIFRLIFYLFDKLNQLDVHLEKWFQHVGRTEIVRIRKQKSKTT